MGTSRHSEQTVRVFIADDHGVVREGLRAMVESQPDLEVVGEAADGQAAVDGVGELEPDVAVMDIAMPEMDGIEAASEIRKKAPAARIVLLSMHATSEHLFRALQAGVAGYVLKEAAGSELIKAIRAAHRGQRYLSPKLEEMLVKDFLRGHGQALETSPLASLSKRERQILQLVVEGRSSREIAETLYLSPKTVETYRSRLMHKLGVKGMADLMRFAVANGLLS